MQYRLPPFTTTALYLTEVTALCNFYVFFAGVEAYGYGYIALLPWLALSLVVFTFIHWYVQQERSLGQVVAVGAVCCLVMSVVMSLWFIHAHTVWSWIFAWLFMGISVARACVFNTTKMGLGATLTHCELPIIGIGFLLFMTSGAVFVLPAYQIEVTIAVLLVSILALAVTKMQVAGGYGVLGDKAALATILACFAVMGGLAYGFVQLLASRVANTAYALTQLVSRCIAFVFSLIEAAFLWWASLFPETSGESFDMAATEAVEMMEEVAEEEPSALAMLILMVIGAAVILMGLVWLLGLLRKVRIKRRRLQLRYTRPQQRVERGSLWKRFCAFIRRVWGNLSFHYRLLRQRNTPKGCALWLSLLGKRRGVAKAVGESYYAYLNRLAVLCAPLHQEGAQAMTQLAIVLNNTLYAPQSTPQTLPPKHYALMRKTLGQLEKQKKK